MTLRLSSSSSITSSSSSSTTRTSSTRTSSTRTRTISRGKIVKVTIAILFYGFGNLVWQLHLKSSTIIPLSFENIVKKEFSAAAASSSSSSAAATALWWKAVVFK